jgi:hypothetical protein
MNYISIALLGLASLLVISAGLLIRMPIKLQQGKKVSQPTIIQEIQPSITIIPTIIIDPTIMPTKKSLINKSTTSSNSETTIQSNGLSLHIKSPQNGSVVHDSSTLIEGTATKESIITVNNQQIEVNNNGEFSLNIPLVEGENTIKVTADDKKGSTIQQSIKVTYSSPI